MISSVYGQRKASLQAELTASQEALSKMVKFGEGGDLWDAGLSKSAKQDAVFARAAKTCLTVKLDDITKATARLSQATL